MKQVGALQWVLPVTVSEAIGSVTSPRFSAVVSHNPRRPSALVWNSRPLSAQVSAVCVPSVPLWERSKHVRKTCLHEASSAVCHTSHTRYLLTVNKDGTGFSVADKELQRATRNDLVQAEDSPQGQGSRWVQIQ
ncbi:hypothetical protein SKAU_G00168590 [Synaphobranchus kaupii]|uniref:Uncharacterized protein n=1 Tax=Synaphobranchus kaupii TaxID=118154 RepID=A0A9Q1FJY6_SYNKA|nr:hypothetical protein SKAU_G00168590 [Synaphobranchus kaupii]